MRLLFTVPTTDSRIIYSGNGSTVAFPTGFVFELNTHIVVSLVDSAGAVSTLTEGVHYTLAGGSGVSGTVTMGTAPATGETLVIQRIVPFTQLTNLRDGDPFRATTQMLTYDRIVEMIQQLADLVSRGVLGPITTPVTGDGAGFTFPAPTDETVIVGTGSGWESRAISDLISGTGFSLSSISIYNASTTWEKPSPTWEGFLIVECVGGGGGGGGVASCPSNNAAAAGGGGGGAYAWARIPDIDLAATVAITIGAGGAGAAAGNNPGSAGGATSFGSAVVAAGGAGGAGAAAASSVGSSGAAGGTGGLASASTGDLTADGGDGSNGVTLSDETGGGTAHRFVAAPGDGGGSVYGHQSRGGFDASGNAGKKYGGGGSGGSANGGSTARSGGSGYSGVCIVYQFGGSA